MDDLAPPPKRRRTSQDNSDYSPRPPSRQYDLPMRASSERSHGDDRSDRSEQYTRPRSRRDSIEKDDYREQERSARERSQSSEYSPRPAHSRSESQNHRRQDSRSTSASYRTSSPGLLPSHKSKSSKKLAFNLIYTLPRAHARGITSVKFSPDLSLLAAASADATITVYTVQPTQTPALKLLRTLRAHLAGVNALAWSPVGPNYTLASASDDKSILLWSPMTSDFPISPSPLTGHSNYVYSLAFSPKGNMLVSGSYDEAVFLWDVRSAKVMRTLPAHSDPVSGVDFLRDGSMVCSCASDGLIRIWDSGTGQCLKTLVHEDRKPVTSVRFAPNGKFVCAWTLDGCIRLWRYTEGKCVKTYTGHINEEFSLGGTIGSYSSYGIGAAQEAFVVSGSEDGDLVAWDISSKEVLWRGKAHNDVVLSVDFGRQRNLEGQPTGRGMMVSGGKDRDLRLWAEDGVADVTNGIEDVKLNGVVNGTANTNGDIHVDGDDAVMQDEQTVDADMLDS